MPDTPDTPDTLDQPDTDVSPDTTPDTEADTTPDTEHDTDDETFPREYVEKLRREAATYRDRAKDRDALAERLHVALVAATGRLADPSDLPFADEHLADQDALNAAIDDLLARKPHLASRRPHGTIGQGATPQARTVDLAAMLRRAAG